MLKSMLTDIISDMNNGQTVRRHMNFLLNFRQEFNKKSFSAEQTFIRNTVFLSI